MNERIEEQPYDERHNVPRIEGDHIGNHEQQGVPYGFTLPERGKAQSYTPSELIGRDYDSENRTNPWVGVPPGLHFMSEGPSGVFSDIGRTFNREAELGGVDTLDLRVILAHLDSAAKAIQRELESRHR